LLKSDDAPDDTLEREELKLDFNDERLEESPDDMVERSELKLEGNPDMFD
jgi:hypothetical protein